MFANDDLEFAKPFVPPTADMPLRFRYTTYMGEQHPAERKVVMEFCTLDMPNLTRIQRMKLIKLAGVRYNPETDIVKMSCEMFPSQAQNKRYLGDLVDEMLREARVCFVVPIGLGRKLMIFRMPKIHLKMSP
jgi:small subunit ribosomal protein S35